MNLKIEHDLVPLRTDAHGVVRVGDTRVTLDTVIAAYNEGATADEMVLRYPVLQMADIYSILGFYLRHKQEVETYLEYRRQTTEQILKEAESMFPRDDVRQRLLAREIKGKINFRENYHYKEMRE
ncbi:MAG: DUF433 domain-containing protein [bacterium]|nr:DUF433 domain-containing protein [bacterium]